eukprot:snap_masked-scaffold_40-processed-gene-2.38-mRNA-1 protein AED:1.00 eAED:1.00 QI:0/-1/0/0/-1/1/1/0/64
MLKERGNREYIRDSNREALIQRGNRYIASAGSYKPCLNKSQKQKAKLSKLPPQEIEQRQSADMY